MTSPESDHAYAISERAKSIHANIFELLACRVDEAIEYASHKLSRVKAGVFLYAPESANTPYTPVDQAFDDAMAWFPPAPSTGGIHVLSSALTSDGTLGPNSVIVGWVQVHVGQWIWWGWRSELSLSVRWSDVSCIGRSIYWDDEYRRRWRLDFTPYLAGGPPAWPDRLLDGVPGRTALLSSQLPSKVPS
jgi:hypothetical protein